MITALPSCSEKKDGNTLKIVGFSIEDNYNEYIENFKIENPDINVEIIDFSIGNDFYQSLEQFNTSLFSEDCGDILLCNTYTDIKSLAKNNIISNLYENEYINKNKNKYLQNILKSCEVDGKLCSLFPSFSINAYVCKNKYILTENWNLDSFEETTDDIIKKKLNLFANSSVDNFQTIYGNIIDYYYYNGGIDKNSTKLVNILENMKKLNDISIENKTIAKEHEAFYFDDIVASNEIIGSFDYYYYLNKGVFREDISLLGYPLENNELTITPNNEIALFEKSKNNKNAIRFLEFVFSEVNQEMVARNLSEFPITESNMQLCIDLTLSNMIHNEKGEPIEIKTNECYIGDDLINIGIPSKSDIINMIDIVYSVDYIDRKNTFLRKMLSDSLSPYWNDSITSQNAFDILKDSFEIYKSEKE